VRVLHWYSRFSGGGAVANAVRALALAQTRYGISAKVATLSEYPDESRDDCQPDVVPIGRWLSLPGGRRFALASGRRILGLRSERPDVVHLHGVYIPESVYALATTGPVVWTPHGGLHSGLLAGPGSWKRRRFVAALGVGLGRRIRAIHALTPSEEAEIASIEPDINVTTIPIGPTDDAFCASPPAVPAHEGPLCFVYVGRLDVRSKGLDILLDAFSAAARSVEVRPRLLLVGPDVDGGMRRLLEQARRLEIDDLLEFAGAVPRSAVRARLEGADWFVLVSLHEGFGTSAAEALMTGLPALLSTTSGVVSYPFVQWLPHVVRVEPDVEEVTQGLTRALRLGRSLRTTAVDASTALRRHFDWAELTPRYVDLYRRAIDS
jgi:glycosyltransferase involved in cell wall biosynthesis